MRVYTHPWMKKELSLMCWIVCFHCSWLPNLTAPFLGFSPSFKIDTYFSARTETFSSVMGGGERLWMLNPKSPVCLFLMACSLQWQTPLWRFSFMLKGMESTKSAKFCVSTRSLRLQTSGRAWPLLLRKAYCYCKGTMLQCPSCGAL